MFDPRHRKVPIFLAGTQAGLKHVKDALIIVFLVSVIQNAQQERVREDRLTLARSLRLQSVMMTGARSSWSHCELPIKRQQRWILALSLLSPFPSVWVLNLWNDTINI